MGYQSFLTHYDLLETLEHHTGDNYDDGPEGDSNFKLMIKMWYFGLTTLSTIGYGDYSAKSSNEKYVLGILMLFGVSVFSYIMGNLIEILATFNSLDSAHDHRDLTKWIALLSKLSGGKKFKKSLVLKIE
jgi:hypothetical protein